MEEQINTTTAETPKSPESQEPVKAAPAQPKAGEQEKAESPAEQKGPDTLSRAEAEKLIAAERKKAALEARRQYEKELQEKQDAEKKAKEFESLQADKQLEILKQQAEDFKRQLEEKEREHSAYLLKEKAFQRAGDIGLPVSLISDLDYGNIEPDKLDGVLEARKKDFDAEVEKRLNTRLRQDPPETHIAAEIKDPFIAGFDS